MLLSEILVSFEKVYVKITEQMQIYVENIRNFKKTIIKRVSFFLVFLAVDIIFLLTHFNPFSFYNPEKHSKISDFMMFAEAI